MPLAHDKGTGVYVHDHLRGSFRLLFLSLKAHLQAFIDTPEVEIATLSLELFFEVQQKTCVFPSS
jgi:hypothetical protein